MKSDELVETLTFLFTDIEGSTSLWEREAEWMRLALARHDALARATVKHYNGTAVKMTGDGIHAVFGNPLDAIGAAVELQLALEDPDAAGGTALRVRCGIHAGVVELRDNDYFGSPVNRASRIMDAAHGGQVLLSQAVANLIDGRLPGGLALRDLGSVRLRDLLNPERIYQLLHPLLRGEFPALRSLEATPNNLPQSLTSFVGREADLAEVRTLLERTRLLTLLGAGGIGKTRLSVQVAADIVDEYPDGVWFVELAPLTDSRLVSHAVATVLGVKEEAGCPVIEALVKFISDRHLLLILDNCEHLVQACADLVAELLQAGPQLKVLASSREHLNVAGETTYSVPTLGAPNPQQTFTPAGLSAYESVRLFSDRAVAAQPAFRVTQQNATSLANICHHLDGLPLAIELAAARVRTLSVEEIAARLTDRFRLLTNGSRTALPRQQTLRSLIDWSYDLLTQKERALLRRLAAFAGGWTLDAAEAVGAGGELEAEEVLDLHIALVEKSLVSVEANRGRYSLLETVRQYAEERLDESGEGAATRARHLAFYLSIAETARIGLTGPDLGSWLSRLDLERQNLLAAHACCDRAENASELGLRLVYAVQPYLLRRGVLELGHRAVAEALARPGAEVRNLVRCKALFAAGWHNYFMGRYEDASVYLEESLSIAREIEDRTMVAAVLQPLGMASLGQGATAKARQRLEEALAFAREDGDKHQIAAALNALGQLSRLEGQLDQAEPLYANVLELARDQGDREGVAFALLNLAMASIGRQRVDRVLGMLLEAVAIADEIGSMPTGQSVLEVSAGLGAQNEDWKGAAIFFGAAEAQAAQTGLRRDPADEAFLAPLIGRARVALGAAEFSAAEAIGRALPYDVAMSKVHTWLETALRAEVA